MALCERCSAEIHSGFEPLPETHFDNLQHRIRRPDGQWHPVPRLAWKVLCILWHRRHQPHVTLESLVMLLYSGPHDLDEPQDAYSCIKVYICRLRHGLEGLPFSIVTKHRIGYRVLQTDKVYPRFGPGSEVGPLEPCDGPQPEFTNKYPFSVMQIGQSFLVRNGDRNTIRSAIRGARLRGTPGRFAMTQEATGLRVTRQPD